MGEYLRNMEQLIDDKRSYTPKLLMKETQNNLILNLYLIFIN